MGKFSLKKLTAKKIATFLWPAVEVVVAILAAAAVAAAAVIVVVVVANVEVVIAMVKGWTVVVLKILWIKSKVLMKVIKKRKRKIIIKIIVIIQVFYKWNLNLFWMKSNNNNRHNNRINKMKIIV